MHIRHRFLEPAISGAAQNVLRSAQAQLREERETKKSCICLQVSESTISGFALVCNAGLLGVFQMKDC